MNCLDYLPECKGRCCSIPALFGDDALTKEEKEFFKECYNAMIEGNGPKFRIKCKYLGKNNKCKIYSKRPLMCRDFWCERFKK